MKPNAQTVLNAVEADVRGQADLSAYLKKHQKRLLDFTDRWMREGVVLVFAFGSNLQKKQTQDRTGESVPFARATLEGYALAFAGQSRTWGGPVATVVPSRGKSTQGAVYALTKGGLHLLDRYEGYPVVYGRKLMTVTLEDGSQHKAWVYYHTRDAVAEPPSAAYAAAINNGRAEWGYGPLYFGRR